MASLRVGLPSGGSVLLGGSGFGRSVFQRVLGEARVQKGLWDTRSALKDRFGPSFREVFLGRPGPSLLHPSGPKAPLSSRS